MSEIVVTFPGGEGDLLDNVYELRSLDKDPESCSESQPSKSVKSYFEKISGSMKIFRSRDDLGRLVGRYKVLAFTSSLAVIGLIITLRMVSKEMTEGRHVQR